MRIAEGKDNKKIESDITVAEVSPDDLTAQVKEMLLSIKYKNSREDFFDDVNSLKVSKLFNKWFAEIFRVRLDRTVRIFCYKAALYRNIKSI